MKIDTTEKFIELVEVMCKRPGMFVGMPPYYWGIVAYINGYADGSETSPLSGPRYETFQAFVSIKHRYREGPVHWSRIIWNYAADDSDAVERLRNILVDFCTKALSMSDEQILQQAKADLKPIIRGEPEKVFDQFVRIVFRGRRNEIEPLILPHPEANVLWELQPPEQWANEIDMSGTGVADRLSGTEEEGVVTLMTFCYGRVIVRRVDGTWRVDATREIAECKKSLERRRQVYAAMKAGKNPWEVAISLGHQYPEPPET